MLPAGLPDGGGFHRHTSFKTNPVRILNIMLFYHRFAKSQGINLSGGDKRVETKRIQHEQNERRRRTRYSRQGQKGAGHSFFDKN
jgi:hypothetical protein